MIDSSLAVLVCEVEYDVHDQYGSLIFLAYYRRSLGASSLIQKSVILRVGEHTQELEVGQY